MTDVITAALLPPDRLSPAFRDVLLDRCASGSYGLVADLTTLDDRYAAGAAAAQRHGIRLLCAVKASTHPEVLAGAARAGLGFDVANAFEVAAAREASPSAFLSLTSPGLPFGERAALYEAFRRGEIDRWHCDSLAQLEELARECPGSPVGVRVNLDGLEIPEGMPLWRPSRFGIRLDQLPLARDIAAGYGCSLRWVHAHNGSEENDLASYVFTASAIVSAASAAGLKLASVDLGGGLLSEPADLDPFFSAVRAAVPAGVEVILEPGRFWMTDCMALVTQVLDVKETASQVVLLLDLGLMSHLQWADHIRIPVLGTLVPGDTRPWRICGRSCFEEDWLDEWEPIPVAEGGPLPRPGDPFVLGNITGYAIELACDFNGVHRPAASFLRT
ncbi:diaminopimelate decarboxylase family protein [Actinokineospora terrae]|uniref:Diaminopimelate decarboxylase n=1 Tax=Actinokineospora terrae TaxID=155974 RepID=A0A1H9KVM6_9PSEU|nr:hypothetical protein [Actinokineospora terrae]SER03089.1 Diaminopimelate decarboxylase [Actinokineospora terrae]